MDGKVKNIIPATEVTKAERQEDMVRIVEAYDKDGAVVAWSDVPKEWNYSDEEISTWYRLQIERDKGIKVTTRVL